MKLSFKKIWLQIKSTLFTWTAAGLRKIAQELDQLNAEKLANKK